MKVVREFLNKVQIGYKCRSTFITVNFTAENSKIVQFFYEKNWIKMYSVQNNKIVVYLRYVNNKPLFIKIKFVSTAGSRKYFTKEGITFFRKNLGGSARILLNTSYGLLSSKTVENLAIGGEISYILYE